MVKIRNTIVWSSVFGMMALVVASIILITQLPGITGNVSPGLIYLLGLRSGLGQAITNCATSGPSSGAYTAELCIALQDNNDTVSGVIPITGTLNVSGTTPGVRTVVFYLGGEYLLTDYEAPYTFELPTAQFVDGAHRLSVDVLMRDGFITDQAVIALNFANGVTTPPVNTKTFTPSSGRPAGPGEPFIVAAVGDGAGGRNDAAQVVDLIASWNPNLFLYLGDVYDKGSPTEFYNWYGDETRLFGRFRAITNPIIGDHEYEKRQAPGYFSYWDNIPDYYSFDAAGWHFISLNSSSQLAQRNPGSPQYEWLLKDLKASISQCTVVFIHNPIFSVGRLGGDDRLIHIWAALAQNGVEMVLSGNDHDYQRWQPLNAAGSPEAGGTVPFVVGTGGQGIRDFVSTDARLAKGYDASSGVTVLGALNMKLNPQGLEYRFINIAGAVLDSGVIACESADADATPPTAPTGLTSTLDAAGYVVLNWAAAHDDTGVAGYTIYRNDVALTTLDGGALSYTDASAAINATYTYTLKAFDPANNKSDFSAPTTITTQSAITLVLTAVADAYVDESAADVNYGNSSRLRMDSTPPVRIYVRFEVPKLLGDVVSANLRLYANSTSSVGHDVYAVSQNDWDEAAITYDSAPLVGDLIGSSKPFQSDTWVSVDVTSFIAEERSLSFAVETLNTTNTSYSSREGTNPPELVIELGVNPASNGGG